VKLDAYPTGGGVLLGKLHFVLSYCYSYLVARSLLDNLSD
jgi:hypothetical protein